VCAAIGYALQIVNLMPGFGRDRVMLPRLWISYKIMASKAIGICPVIGGTIVPYIRPQLRKDSTVHLGIPFFS
jgi:hypothetical protein